MIDPFAFAVVFIAGACAGFLVALLAEWRANG